jgi:glutathione S-transferase
VKSAGFGRGDPAFMQASPFGKIPALEDGDFLICDSTAIITYMDALHPEPNLIPTEPKARARTIWYEEFGDTIAQAAGAQVFFNRVVGKALKLPHDPALADAAEAEKMPLIYDYLEGVLPQSGWLVEDRFTLADIAASCPLINVGYCSKGLTAERWPKVTAWMERIRARPSFAEALAQEAAIVAKMAA